MGFLKKLVGFENSFSKNFTKDTFDKPSRLLTGIDPASTKVWNTVLGRDDKPLVNVYGSPGQQYYDQAQADGIDTAPAQAFHSVADKVAGFYGMQGISGIGGGAAGATSGTGGSGMGLMDMFSGGSGGSSGWGSLLGGVLGAASSYSSAKDQAKAASQQGQLDPRIASLIFGDEKNSGLINQYLKIGQQPRSDAANNFANANANYLSGYGGADLDVTRQAALKAMGGNSAPTVSAAQANASPSGGATAALGAYANGSMVQAPSQNGTNLSSSYNSLIYGEPGNNPALTGAIQKGLNQSANTFGNFVEDAKKATQDVLGGIRSNAILNGQFGGSRQGLAEGKAIDSMNTNISRALSQVGQNNTDAAVSAQAGAYDADRNRQLAATQGLGAQQYGVASQNANTQNAAEFMNVGNVADYGKFNAGLAQNNAQFNASQGQQNNQFNAGLQQQAGLANQNAQLGTNAQNNSSSLAGAGLLSGLLGGASGQVNANDNWNLDRAGQVNSMLSGLINGTPRQNPVSANSGAAALGGGLAGLGLGNSLAGLFKNMGGSSSSPAGTYFDGYGNIPLGQ